MDRLAGPAELMPSRVQLELPEVILVAVHLCSVQLPPVGVHMSRHGWIRCDGTSTGPGLWASRPGATYWFQDPMSCDAMAKKDKSPLRQRCGAAGEGVPVVGVDALNGDTELASAARWSLWRGP